MNTLAVGMKRCIECQQLKTVDEFSPDKQSKTGRIYRRSHCKLCYNLKQNRVYRNKPELRAFKVALNRRRRTGCTPKQYEELFRIQGGKCAICGATPENNMLGNALGLDHDHRTGKIRGLLCSPCNRGLGYFRDSPTLLQNAITYMRKLEEQFGWGLIEEGA